MYVKRDYRWRTYRMDKSDEDVAAIEQTGRLTGLERRFYNNHSCGYSKRREGQVVGTYTVETEVES